MPVRTPRPWLMLAAAVLAQAATTVVYMTPPFLIPLLHGQLGVPLPVTGVLAAAPSSGTMLTLVGWGWAADRWGERRVLTIGLAATAATVLLTIVASGSGYVWLGIAFVLVGAASACANAASGRLIAGWFPPERRGLAMGIRQSAQPLGVAIGALVIPPLVAGGDLLPALTFDLAVVLAAAAVCVAVVVDPPRPPAPAAGESDNPYRRGSALARIHAVSVLLVVPQFALSSFGLVWFVVGLGWDELAAGLVVAAAQLLGAAGRILVGMLSDRVRSRLRPLRWVALAGIGVLLVTALFGWLEWSVPAAVAYILASAVSVADNGLAFTAVAELAGPRWAGRALGIQNTGQFAAGTVGLPLVAALIAAVGYPAAWALIALAPLVATPLVPSARVERLR